MTPRQDVLAFGCSADDIAVLTKAIDPLGTMLRIAEGPGEFARRAVADRPLAVILGVGHDTLSYLEMISVIRAVRRDLPVVLVAEDASLDLERRARQHKIFYYLVHPFDQTEISAVLADVMRSTK